MKLWVVARIADTNWDEYDSFVIRAENEQEAREIAYDADYNCGEYNDLWKDLNKSTCECLSEQGEAEVISFNYKSG